MPATYMIMVYDLRQVKEEHVNVLAPEFRDMDVAQFMACVTRTATLGRIKCLVYQAGTALRILPAITKLLNSLT
jgi:hypothetical protein